MRNPSLSVAAILVFCASFPGAFAAPLKDAAVSTAYVPALDPPWELPYEINTEPTTIMDPEPWPLYEGPPVRPLPIEGTTLYVCMPPDCVQDPVDPTEEFPMEILASDDVVSQDLAADEEGAGNITPRETIPHVKEEFRCNHAQLQQRKRLSPQCFDFVGWTDSVLLPYFYALADGQLAEHQWLDWSSYEILVHNCRATSPDWGMVTDVQLDIVTPPLQKEDKLEPAAKRTVGRKSLIQPIETAHDNQNSAPESASVPVPPPDYDADYVCFPGDLHDPYCDEFYGNGPIALSSPADPLSIPVMAAGEEEQHKEDVQSASPTPVYYPTVCEEDAAFCGILPPILNPETMS